MPLPAIPVVLAGAMKLYKGYQIAKFVKVAFNTLNENNLDNPNQTKMSKFLNIGKAALGAVDAVALQGKGGVLVKGLNTVGAVDSGVNIISKLGDLKSGTLMDKIGTLKSVLSDIKTSDTLKPKIK